MKGNEPNTTRWVGVIGSWRAAARPFEKKVRELVREAARRGEGIITGAAIGVDRIAIEEALKFDPEAARLKVFLECGFEEFIGHYRKRAGQGMVKREAAEALIALISGLRGRNPAAVVDHPGTPFVDKAAYFARNTRIVEAADSLAVFVTLSDTSVGAGTMDAVVKAKQKGIPVQVFERDKRSKFI